MHNIIQVFYSNSFTTMGITQAHNLLNFLHILQLLDFCDFFSNEKQQQYASVTHEIFAYLTSSYIVIFCIIINLVQKMSFISFSLVNGPGMSSFLNFSKRSCFVDSSFGHDFSLSKYVLSWWALIFSFHCIMMSLISFEGFWEFLYLYWLRGFQQLYAFIDDFFGR